MVHRRGKILLTRLRTRPMNLTPFSLPVERASRAGLPTCLRDRPSLNISCLSPPLWTCARPEPMVLSGRNLWSAQIQMRIAPMAGDKHGKNGRCLPVVVWCVPVASVHWGSYWPAWAHMLYSTLDVSTHTGYNRGAAGGAHPRVGQGPNNPNHRGPLPQPVCGSSNSLWCERSEIRA